MLTSCSVPDKASLEVRNETKNLRKSPVTLEAHNAEKKTDDHLKLRENSSFEYSSRIVGTQKSVYYAGTFTKSGDSLFLSFHKNYKDSLWTGLAVIDTAKRQITLISKNTDFNKQMTVTKLK